MEHVDQLLEEYLRVINAKDDEVQQLTKALERQRSIQRKREDDLGGKLQVVKKDLSDKRRLCKTLQEKSIADDTAISKLVNASEGLHKELSAAQQQLKAMKEGECAIEQRHHQEIASMMARLQEEQAAQAKQHEDDKIQLRVLATEQEALTISIEEKTQAMKKALIEAEKAQSQLQVAEAAKREFEATVKQLTAKLEASVDLEVHRGQMHELQARVLAVQQQNAEGMDAIINQLRDVEGRRNLLQKEFEQLQKDSKTREGELQTTANALVECRQQLYVSKTERQHVEESLQREVQQAQRAAEKEAARVTELERQLGTREEQLQRTSASLHEARLECERFKSNAEKVQESTHVQIKAMEGQVRQQREEAERCHRLLESHEADLREVTASLQQCRQHHSQSENDLKEKLAIAQSSVASRKEECDRLSYELKHAQQQVQDVQNRSVQEQRTLEKKLEEQQAIAHRQQQQLRDKEEEVRRQELLYTKQAQEMEHLRAIASAEQHRSSEAELKDIRAKMERYREELLELTGGNKGLTRELRVTEEAYHTTKDEINRLQYVVSMKDDAIAQVKRDLEALQSKLMREEQRQLLQKQNEERLLDDIASGKRVAEESQCSLRAAQRKIDDTEKQLAEKAAENTRLKNDLCAKEATVTALREQLVEQQAARAGAEQGLKLSSEACKDMRERLAQVEKVQREAQADLEDTTRNLIDARRSRDAAEEEVKRQKLELEEKSGECSRVAQHAKEVEALARARMDELHSINRQRDEIEDELRHEQSALALRLAEEQSKCVALSERQKQEFELAEAKQASVTAQVAELCQKLQVAEVNARSAREEAHQLRAQLKPLEESCLAKDTKLTARKEALRKAYEELSMIKESMKECKRQMEEEVAAAQVIREKYKKEKAKMDSLVQHHQTRASTAEDEVKASRHREAALHREIEDIEALRRREEEGNANLVARLKDEAAYREDELQRMIKEATHRTDLAEEQSKGSRASLHDAQERLEGLQQRERTLRRQLVQSKADELTQFEEYALYAKRALVEVALHDRRAFLSLGISGLLKEFAQASHDACAEAEEKVKRTEHAVAQKINGLHARQNAALNAVEEEHKQRLAQISLRNAMDVAKLREAQRAALSKANDETVDLRTKLSNAQDDARRAQQDLERVRAELAHCQDQRTSLAAQLTAEDEQVDKCFKSLEAERKATQHSQDKLTSQLSSSAAEQREAEAELHGLRMEVSALQKRLCEKEEECATIREALRGESERLAGAVATGNHLQAQVMDQRKHNDLLRKELAEARLSLQQLAEKHHGSHHAVEGQLLSAQAELSAARSHVTRLERQTQSQELKVGALTREVQELREKEADISGQLQARKSECSSLHERCANLESLKNINDSTIAEAQLRERDLLEKIEELRHAQQLLQFCFDKQQEQLENGRRIRFPERELCAE